MHSPDDLALLDLCGWKHDSSKPGKWENRELGQFGVDAPAITLDLVHEAETKLTDEQHSTFRDILRSLAAREFDLEPERAYVSADVSDRKAALIEVAELAKLAAEVAKEPDASDPSDPAGPEGEAGDGDTPSTPDSDAEDDQP